jgi:TP901-1 family phage major tail protein
MTAQNGRDCLVKMDIASTFTTLTGTRSFSAKLSDGNSDVSSADSPGQWREMLAGTGMMMLSVSGQGVIKDSAVEKQALANKIARATPDFQVVIPGVGTFEGAFVIGDLEYAGNYDGEATYNFAIESAEELAFTPEA